MFQKQTRNKLSSSCQDNIFDCQGYGKTNTNLHDSIFCKYKNEDDKLTNSKMGIDDYKKMISTNSQINQTFKTKLADNKTNNILYTMAPQELEIMEIFTSSEWSNKTFSKPIVVDLNVIEEKEIEVNHKLENNDLDTITNINLYKSNQDSNNLIEIIDNEEISIDENENENVSIPNSRINSFDSLKLFLEDEQDIENNIESINETNEKLKGHSKMLSSTEKSSENISLKTFEYNDKTINYSGEFSEGLSCIENMSFETLKCIDNTKNHKREFSEVLSCTGKSSENSSFETLKQTDSINNNLSEKFEVLSCTENPTENMLFQTSENTKIEKKTESQMSNEILSDEDSYKSEKQIQDECYFYRHKK